MGRSARRTGVTAADSGRLAVLATEVVPLETLRLYPGNPRRGVVDVIRESVRQHGQYRALVVNRRTMEVLAGNHLLQALQAEGITEGLAHFVDVDDEEAARIVLVDNRASDLGTYDDALLVELLQGLPDLAGTGYDPKALEDLLSGLSPEAGLVDADELVEPPKEAITQPGDLWLLGDHRLLCGDARDPEARARLTEGLSLGLIATDPPYGVSVDHTWRDDSGLNGHRHGSRDHVLNDTVADWAEAISAWDAPVAYVWHADQKRILVEPGLV